MIIYEEYAGVISKSSIWVCSHNGYLYTADTVEALVLILNNEWEQDKWLVG